MRALLVSGLLVVALRPAAAATFTVFDLAWAGNTPPQLVLGKHVDGRDLKGTPVTFEKAANVLNCNIGAVGDVDVITPSPDCPIFTQQSPQSFEATSANPGDGAALKYTMSYESGVPIGVRARYEGDQLVFSSLLDLPADKIVEVAYFSPSKNRWLRVPVSRGIAQIALPGSSGSVYARGNETAVYKVDWTRPPHSEPASDFATACANKQFDKIAGADTFPRLDYVVCVDAANPAGWPRAVYNKQTIIRPNVTGAIIVRHWKEVVPAATTSGTPVALTPAPFEGVRPLGEGLTSPPGVSVSQDQGTDEAYSLIVIPPHAPGAVHIDVKLVDPTDPSKVRSTYPVDLIVDQAYVGALRLGVGYAFQVNDPTYSAHTAPGSQHAEIARSNANPFELVVGYSLYWDGFRNGRTYSLKYDSGASYAWGLVKRHLGFYFGIGVLSFDKSNVDLLKSLHVGLEVELGRNLSIAGTYVFRRTNELTDDLHVGGPVPESGISTKTGFDEGWGVILNLNTDFFRFAVNPGGH